MAVNDGGALADDHAILDCSNEEMSRLAKLGGEPLHLHRLVEHALHHMIKQRRIFRR